MRRSWVSNWIVSHPCFSKGWIFFQVLSERFYASRLSFWMISVSSMPFRRLDPLVVLYLRRCIGVEFLWIQYLIHAMIWLDPLLKFLYADEKLMLWLSLLAFLSGPAVPKFLVALSFGWGLWIHNSLKNAIFAAWSPLAFGHELNPSVCRVSTPHLKHPLNPSGYLLIKEGSSRRYGYSTPPQISLTGKFAGLGVLGLYFWILSSAGDFWPYARILLAFASFLTTVGVAARNRIWRNKISCSVQYWTMSKQVCCGFEFNPVPCYCFCIREMSKNRHDFS